MGGWVELYPIFFWIFWIFLTLQSPLVRFSSGDESRLLLSVYHITKTRSMLYPHEIHRLQSRVFSPVNTWVVKKLFSPTSFPTVRQRISHASYWPFSPESRYNKIQYNTIRYDTIRYDTIRYDTIRYDTIRYDTIRYEGDTMRCDKMKWNEMRKKKKKKYNIYNLLLNLKGSFFRTDPRIEPKFGTQVRIDTLTLKKIDPPHPRGV